MRIGLHKSLQKAIEQGYVLSIVQFGSSLGQSKFQDVDLAIILRKGCYRNFLDLIYGKNFHGFDISLIKEEEIQGPEKFRFGKHGAHFLFSLIHGRTLYNKNPFKKFNVSKLQIKKSILLSLFIYMENVRRAVFMGKINKSIKKRWPKFLRLCIYLLDDNFKYPEILRLSDSKLKKYLQKYNLDSSLIFRNSKDPKDWLITYETIWEKVLIKKDL